MAESGGVLRELLAVFGFGVDTEGLKEGENKLEAFAGKIKKLGEGLAGLFALHEIHEFVESNVHAVEAIEHTATQLGISTDRVQEFQFAAKSLGLESDHLLNSMGRLQVAQQGAAGGSQQAATAFAALGVHVKDANGHFKTADELFLDVADGISKQTDASKQAALATQLFGRSGRTLLPFLKEGRDGAEDMARTFHELGGGFDEETIRGVKEFTRQSAKLDQVITYLKNKIMHFLVPAFTWLNEKLTWGIKTITELTKHSHILEAIFLVLGAAATYFAVQMAIASWPILAVAAALGFVVLLVDDLITMFNGGDSLIGRAIDTMFGKGQSLVQVEKLKIAWRSVLETLHEVNDAIDRVLKSAWGGVTDNLLVQAAHGLGFQTPLEKLFPGTKPAIEKGAFGPPEAPPAWMVPPSSALPPGGGVMAGDVTVNVTTPPGLDEKQVGEHVAKQVGEVLKQHHRDAASTLKRGTSP